MAKYREIRARIEGVQNTAKITSAMKMVAAAKLRKAQDMIIAARPYGRKLRELLGFLAASTGGVNPLFEERETERAAVVVIAADRGLCGAFNSNILRAASYLINTRFAELNRTGNLDVFAVGKRSADYFRKLNYNVVGSYPGVFNNLQYTFAQKLVAELREGFLQKKYDSVVLIYNEFKSVIKQTVAVDQFLPIPRVEGAEEGSSAASVDYIFEPSQADLLNALLPKHLNTQLWNALLESNAAEQGARMTAMENATQNADELVRELKLIYNKARQSAITTEILEIVSGAEALKGNG